jgi:hypothetical protein
MCVFAYLHIQLVRAPKNDKKIQKTLSGKKNSKVFFCVFAYLFPSQRNHSLSNRLRSNLTALQTVWEKKLYGRLYI